MNKRALVTLETVVVFTLVVLGFVAMFRYFRGSIQGSWKKNMDTISDGQFEKGVTTETESDVMKVVSPKIKTQLGNTNVADHTNEVIQVTGWGYYSQ